MQEITQEVMLDAMLEQTQTLDLMQEITLEVMLKQMQMLILMLEVILEVEVTLKVHLEVVSSFKAFMIQMNAFYLLVLTIYDKINIWIKRK